MATTKTTLTLTAGDTYWDMALTHVGWMVHGVRVTDAATLIEIGSWANCDDWWRHICRADAGRYLGPDEDGLEPVYVEKTGDLYDEDGDYLREACAREIHESLHSDDQGGLILVYGQTCYVTDIE